MSFDWHHQAGSWSTLSAFVSDETPPNNSLKRWKQQPSTGPRFLSTFSLFFFSAHRWFLRGKQVNDYRARPHGHTRSRLAVPAVSRPDNEAVIKTSFLSRNGNEFSPHRNSSCETARIAMGAGKITIKLGAVRPGSAVDQFNQRNL